MLATKCITYAFQKQLQSCYEKYKTVVKTVCRLVQTENQNITIPVIVF